MTDQMAREHAMDWTDQSCTVPPTVLVADPDATVRDFMRAALEEIGLAVLEARDATEVRKCLHKEAVGLVFAEVMLPHVTGDKLAAEIIRRDILLVLMSGQPEGVRRAQKVRQYLLRKPLKVKDILRVAVVSLPSWRRHV